MLAHALLQSSCALPAQLARFVECSTSLQQQWSKKKKCAMRLAMGRAIAKGRKMARKQSGMVRGQNSSS